MSRSLSAAPRAISSAEYSLQSGLALYTRRRNRGERLDRAGRARIVDDILSVNFSLLSLLFNYPKNGVFVLFGVNDGGSLDNGRGW
jgi:hypothetical protein